MPAITTMIALASVAVAGAGVAMSMKAASANQEAQNTIISNQKAEQAAQTQQMNLDAMRRKREIVRQSLAARANSLATTTNQGASLGSGLAGAYGGISGRTGTNYLGTNQNQELGAEIGQAKLGILGGYQQAAAAQTMGAIGSGLTSLGGAALKNIGMIDKLGDYFTGGFGGLGKAST